MIDEKKVKDFLHFVAQEVTDENFEKSASAFAEIACRKLVNLGIMSVEEQEDGKYYVHEWPEEEE